MNQKLKKIPYKQQTVSYAFFFSFVCLFLFVSLAKAQPPDFNSDNPYAVLGLKNDEAFEVVEKQRRRLLMKYHPDRVQKKIIHS